MDVAVCAQLQALLTFANGPPVIARRILGDRLAFSVDGDLILPDGAPLFGELNTARGILLAILVTPAGSTTRAVRGYRPHQRRSQG